MKRSEMEQILYEVLLRHTPEEASMNLADDLLRACENAGMLPPPVAVRHGWMSDENGLENMWED